MDVMDRIGTIRIRGPNLRVSRVSGFSGSEGNSTSVWRKPDMVSTSVRHIAGTGADKDGAPRAGSECAGSSNRQSSARIPFVQAYLAQDERSVA